MDLTLDTVINDILQTATTFAHRPHVRPPLPSWAMTSCVGVNIIGDIPFGNTHSEKLREWFKFLGGKFFPTTSTWYLQLNRFAWTDTDYKRILETLNKAGIIKSITEIFVQQSINDVSFDCWKRYFGTTMCFRARYQERELIVKTIPGIRWDRDTGLWYTLGDANLSFTSESSIIDSMGWFVGMKPRGTTAPTASICPPNQLSPITETHVLIHPTALRGISISSHPQENVVVYNQYILSENDDLLDVIPSPMQVTRKKAKEGWNRLISCGYIPINAEYPNFPFAHKKMIKHHNDTFISAQNKYDIIVPTSLSA